MEDNNSKLFPDENGQDQPVPAEEEKEERIPYRASSEENASIETVSEEPPKKDNKKTLILIVCAVIAVIAVALVVILSLSGKEIGKNNEDASEETTAKNISTGNISYEDFTGEYTDENGNVISREEYVSQLNDKLQNSQTQLNPENIGTESPNEIVENTTAPVTQGSTASDKDQLSKAEAQIKAFFNHSCYYKGAVYSSTENAPLSVAFDGDNFEFLTNLEGVEVSFAKIDGKLYLKRPAVKQYVELSDAVMSLIGFDADSLNLDMTGASFSAANSKLVGTYDITVNGEKGVCHEYSDENGKTIKFYSVDGNLVQINSYNSDGTTNMEMVISYFSESIPGDQLTLKGFASSSIFEMFADIM